MKKGVKVYCHTDLSLFVKADKNMIATVLRNLVNNALKFTPTGGKIEITMEKKKGMIQINIKDTGVGIDESKIKNLFALERNKSSLGTEGEKGTGLGLIICKEFIQKHGGTIWAESEEGKGSRFHFTIPVIQG